LMWIKWPALRTRSSEADGPTAHEGRAVAMRLHSYRDESHSRHFDLIGGGGHPWSIDLVYVTASTILVVAFGCALVAHVVR
jgi:hypothetical protein